MVDLGKRLRELREERGMTQKGAAQRLGVTAAMVSAYENGIRQPSYEVLIKLVHLYGVSADYLLGITFNRTIEPQHIISLDGLDPLKITLVCQLVKALRE